MIFINQIFALKFITLIVLEEESFLYKIRYYIYSIDITHISMEQKH